MPGLPRVFFNRKFSALAIVKRLAEIFVACGLFGFVAQSAAHSLEFVESSMREQEPDVEFVNAPAPDVHLRTPLGQPVGLAEFRGKVVVLSVLDAVDRQAFDLRMRLIAQLQEMIDTARLSERVDFVTLVPERPNAGAERVDAADVARAHGLDRSNWRLLYMPSQRSLSWRGMTSDAYGGNRAPGDEKKEIVTCVIDQTGQVRARFYGIAFNPVNLVVYVGALVNDDHSRQGWR